MKRLVLACGILVSVVSLSMGAMSDGELKRAWDNCAENDKSACQALINNGLPSIGQCDKESCVFVGAVYGKAGRYREAIPYFEKAIALGDTLPYVVLGNIYYQIEDYYNAKKYFEIGCEKVNANQVVSYHNLGVLYGKGEGVRQDYHKAYELYKKACDMKYGLSCSALGSMYENGEGVRQNLSTAKKYYEIACNLGDKRACSKIEFMRVLDMVTLTPEYQKLELERKKTRTRKQKTRTRTTRTRTKTAKV